MNTPLVRRAYNLGLKATANFADVLTEPQIEYYEMHLDELPAAISRGFIFPEQGKPAAESPVIVPTPTLFKASETDLDFWLDQAQKFTAKHLGMTVDLRKQFAIPAEFPWQSVIPVFDPGNMTNRQMVKRVLKELGHEVYEETDVMKYSGSQACKEPTLHFIENSIRPNADTLGKSPNDLRQTGKLYLRLRGYGLAFALYHFAKNDYLDPQTFTWFPEDRLSDGNVANGYWNPGGREVGFGWDGPDSRGSDSGGRVAILSAPITLPT
jgi:hypothetical protein